MMAITVRTWIDERAFPRLGRAIAAADRLRTGSSRKAILWFAAAAFAIGCAWSLLHLDLRWADVRPLPLLAIAVLMVPLSIAYSAVNMMLMGRATGAKIGFRQGVMISVFAQVAEVLPIPGGAIVRTAALVKGGARPSTSTELVVAFSLLWIACSAVGGGAALFDYGLAGAALVTGGAVAIFAVCGWLTRGFGIRVAAEALILRGLGLVLVALRVVLSFGAIGMTVGFVDSLSFAFAIILGTAASLVPAGLGVGEGLSALLAGPVGIAPAAAFLAAAISRMVGLAINMSLALVFLWTDRASTSGPRHD